VAVATVGAAGHDQAADSVAADPDGSAEGAESPPETATLAESEPDATLV
jgi:hypothetical protein